jgi:hypothetical protein
MKFDIDTNGNGHSGVVTIPSGAKREEKEENDILIELEEDGGAFEELSGEYIANVGKRRGRKAVVGTVVIVVILAFAVMSVWYIYGGSKRKTTVLVRSRDASTEQKRSPDELTAAAIAEATQGLTNKPAQSSAANTSQSTAEASPSPISSPWETRNQVGQTGGVTDYSRTVLDTRTNTSQGDTDTSGRTESQPTNTAFAAQISNTIGHGGRNPERSMRFSVLPSSTPALEPRHQPDAPRAHAAKPPIKQEPEGALPSFGSMLPVRSLGPLYTLRLGSLARFELTRDMRGRGWEMRRGTVLVGALRGAEYDRAYVAIVGFINPDSERFVRITGDLLGGDGAPGMKGKRRGMSSGWSRVLGRLGEAGLNVAGSLAAGVSGRHPIIINDGYGSYGGRVTNEIQGVRTGDGRREFIEVAAGSTGYVMITNLPEQIEGIDALSRLSSADLGARSDATQPRRRTGISESELAELIQRGRPDEIRAAMPRMTPEMRRVAQAVLDETEE